MAVVTRGKVSVDPARFMGVDGLRDVLIPGESQSVLRSTCSANQGERSVGKRGNALRPNGV